MANATKCRIPRVLLVGGEDITDGFARQALEAVGYGVMTARNSIKALALAVDYTRGIDVLVIDEGMKMFHNGPELATCIAILRPEANVVLVATGTEPLSQASLWTAVENACIGEPSRQAKPTA